MAWGLETGTMWMIGGMDGSVYRFFPLKSSLPFKMDSF
jgi:hypothetical protein